MKLEGLRGKRAAAALRQVKLARSTIRDQRSDLARVAAQWNRIAKRINQALVRYDRSVEALGISSPGPLRPADLLDCLKGCVDEQQRQPLDDIEQTLADNEREIKAAGRLRSRKLARRTKREETRLQKQLAIGVQIEQEHTTDPEVAARIALDHLREDPDYYTKLRRAGL